MPDSFIPDKKSAQADSFIPDEQPSILDTAKQAITAAQQPIVQPTPDMQKAQESFSEDNPLLGNALKTGTDFLWGMSSPLNVGLGLLSGGTSVAESLGAPRLATALEAPGRIASAGFATKGAFDTGKGVLDTSPSEIASGLAETGMGVLGVRSHLRRFNAEQPNAVSALLLTPEDVAKMTAEDAKKAVLLDANGKALFKGTPEEIKQLHTTMIGIDPNLKLQIRGTPDLVKLGVTPKQISLINEATNFTKSLMASVDVSAPLRQGLGLIYRPEYWKSFNDMFQSLGSASYFDNLMQSIKEKPVFQQMVKGPNGKPISFADLVGMHITQMGSLTQREEQYFSQLAEKLPGVKASERAYYGFLNKLRADTFENMLADAMGVSRQADGKFSPQDMAKLTSNVPFAEKLADYINTATGRGSLGSFEENAADLNKIFFSPRLIASRLKMLNPSTYVFQTPEIRKMYIKSLLSMATFGLSTAALAKGAGADVSLDPTNADFGKIKIGDTRIDPWGGHQQYLVAAAKLLSGQYTSSTSNVTKGFSNYTQTPLGVAGNFTKNKLSPILSFATDIAMGNMGKPTGVGSALPALGMPNINVSPVPGWKMPVNPGDVTNMFIPMFVNDTVDILRSDPSLAQLVGIPAAALGAGVQTYPSR